HRAAAARIRGARSARDARSRAGAPRGSGAIAGRRRVELRRRNRERPAALSVPAGDGSVARAQCAAAARDGGISGGSRAASSRGSRKTARGGMTRVAEKPTSNDVGPATRDRIPPKCVRAAVKVPVYSLSRRRRRRAGAVGAQTVQPIAVTPLPPNLERVRPQERLETGCRGGAPAAGKGRPGVQFEGGSLRA